MKKRFLTLLCAVAIGGATLLISCTSSDGIMTKKKGVYTVDTKIVKVEALENSETPGFFQRMKDGGMLERWNGKTVDEALAAHVDAVAGATYSSNAVIENVRLGLTYYKEHK